MQVLCHQVVSCHKVLLKFWSDNKSLDFSGQLMKLSKHQFEDLEWLIKEDSLFLAEHNLMDYSILLVIEEVPVEAQDLLKTSNTQPNYVTSIMKDKQSGLTTIKETVTQNESDKSIEGLGSQITDNEKLMNLLK